MKRNHVSLGQIRIVIVSLFALAILASAFFVTPLTALADRPRQTPEQDCFDMHTEMARRAKTFEEAQAHVRKSLECVGYYGMP